MTDFDNWKTESAHYAMRQAKNERVARIIWTGAIFAVAAAMLLCWIAGLIR